MTCKIDRTLDPDGLVVMRVSGRIESAHVQTLRELAQSQTALTIDLAEVTVICREAIEVLILAEANGIKLENCPPYVREWLSRERDPGVTDADGDVGGADDVPSR